MISKNVQRKILLFCLVLAAVTPYFSGGGGEAGENLGNIIFWRSCCYSNGVILEIL